MMGFCKKRFEKICGERVYPNPTNESITIETTSILPYRIVLRDITGRLMHQEEVQHMTKLSVTEYLNGLYLCEFWQNDQCIAKEKIIIIH
jgi:hypothetical protein